MIHKKISSSSSSKLTFAFNTLSIQTNDSEEKLHLTQSFFGIDEKNLNRNTNHHIDKNNFNRLIQSSTDLTTNDLYAYRNREDSHKNTKRAIRIESALLTSDYSHLLDHSINYSPRPIIDINMNRTIDLIIKRDGAGDENSASYHSNNKQVQTSNMIDNNRYLTLEHVPIHNRSKMQFTTKQLIFISISVFLFVTFLCLVIFLFIF